MEDAEIVVVRAEYRVRIPSSFMLVGAANPCPCGYLGDPDRECTCSPSQVERYASRIGGPLMDRIDIITDVNRTDPENVFETGEGTSSAKLKEAVLEARERRSFRIAREIEGGLGAKASKDRHVIDSCSLSQREQTMFEGIARRSHLSGRAIMRTLKVARTIADLAGKDKVGEEHLLEALAFRVREGGAS